MRIAEKAPDSTHVSSSPETTTDDARHEKLKFKHALITTAMDKLLFAILVAVAVFFLNRRIEGYKASLQKELQTQGNTYTAELQRVRQANERALADASALQQRELNDLRLEHESNLQALRGEQGAKLESVKSALALRSTLSEKRLNAYMEVYHAGVEAGTILDSFSQASADKRRETIINFKLAWRKNRIFLSDHDVGKVDDFLKYIERPEVPGPVAAGNDVVVNEFRSELEDLLARLRRHLQEQISEEEKFLHGRS